MQTGTIEYYGYGKDGRLLQDWSNRRQVRNGYVYLGNTVVGLYEVNLTNGTVTPKYQHTDALGSPVATTNAGKTVLTRMSYTPYGVPTLPMDGVGYTGHFMDVGTQLTYMQQRYYDSQLGRFLSSDPVAPDPESGDNFGRFKYAASSPFRFTDPDGRLDLELAQARREMSAAQAKASAISVQNADAMRSNRLSEVDSSPSPSLFGWSGDFFVEIEFDAALEENGFDASIGLVVDFDHLGQSGLFGSFGEATGSNLGIGGGLGYVKRDIEGFKR